jgi:hypothetical protein
MTLSEILKKIHLLYEGDIDYPAEGSEDYELRKGLVNAAIDVWEQENVRWRELFTNLSDASDGDKIANTSTTIYSVPSDYRFISSFLYIQDTNGNKTYYVYKRPDDVIKLNKIDSSFKFFYETGGGSSKKINIVNPVDGTIHYSYYKKAKKLSNANDVPEMLNPDFIVYWVLAQLYEQDLRNDKVAQYQALAKQALDYMIIENETKPFNQSYNLAELDYEDGFVFGR